MACRLALVKLPLLRSLGQSYWPHLVDERTWWLMAFIDMVGDVIDNDTTVIAI